jgi:hypothetical protein
VIGFALGALAVAILASAAGIPGVPVLAAAGGLVNAAGAGVLSRRRG